MKVLTVLQARLASTRFPGKVLKKLGSGSVLSVMVERVKRAQLAGTVVVATTTEEGDLPIVDECSRIGVDVFRGHPTDLLDRHYKAQCFYESDVTVKIPTDCPLIDPKVIDLVIGKFLANAQIDYVSNLHPPTYPDGNDVEVMRASALERAWRESTSAVEREHTTPYFWDVAERFRVQNVLWETGKDYSQTHRWVLDYPEDYDFILELYKRLAAKSPSFGLDDILTCLEEEPELRLINSRWLGDSWYLRQGAELNAAKEVAS